MSDAKTVVEGVAFQALNTAITDASVFQDVPENADGRLVIIGDLRSFPLGAKDDPDRRVTVQIISIVSADERAPLLALQHQIETALDGKKFTSDGWTIAFNFEDDDALLSEDGADYVGTSAFTALALKD